MRTKFIGLMMLAVSSAAMAGSQYSGQELRTLKALSDQQVEDYLAGKGMGFAKPAELNHYPGPKHVLDLVDELGLSEAQLRESENIYQAMHADAVEYGRRLIKKETEIETLFADKKAKGAELALLLQQSAAINANIRRAHLAAHIAQRNLLSDAQISKYDQLRGYSGKQHGGRGHHQHH